MIVLSVTGEDCKSKAQMVTPEAGCIRMNEKVPKTISVPAAGRQYFGLGKNASYAAAARGEIPVIRIGARLRVPVAALERMMVACSGKSEANAIG